MALLHATLHKNEAGDIVASPSTASNVTLGTGTVDCLSYQAVSEPVEHTASLTSGKTCITYKSDSGPFARINTPAHLDPEIAAWGANILVDKVKTGGWNPAWKSAQRGLLSVGSWQLL